MKRLDFISWNDYFMNMAILSSWRSKDPNTQVGSIISNKDNKIIGLGYNGMPLGFDEFPWGRDGTELETKYFRVIHSEINAVINSNFRDLNNSILHTTLFPCNECAKIIIQVGIKKVYFLEDKYKNSNSSIVSREMFDKLNVSYELYIPSRIIKLE